MAPLFTSATLYTLLSTSIHLAQAQTPKIIQMPLTHSNLDTAGPFIPLIEIGVGTPPQMIKAILDTGSSDLVVPQTGSPICQSPMQQCSNARFVTGSFDTTNDKSVTDINTPLSTDFTNGVRLQGKYVKTSLTLANTSVSGTQLGLVNDGFLPEGSPLFPIMGIGPIENEGLQPNYQNIPANLKDMGAVNANVYGIYMNDFRSPEGSITFGGIDAAKMSTKLQNAGSLLLNNDGIASQFVIDFSSMALTKGNSSSSSSNAAVDLAPRGGLGPALIDTGNPGINIPMASMRALAMAAGTTFDEQNAAIGPVSCDLGSQGESMTFGFNNNQAKISTPLAAMLVRDTSSGETQCFLPVDASDNEDTISLGAPFMQGAYIVFDLDEKRIFMAGARINATETELKELSAVL